MLIVGVILVIAALVFFVGAVATLIDARRVPVGTGAADVTEVRAQLAAEMDPTPTLAKIGLAAAAVLGVGLFRDTSVDVGVAAFAVGILGLAGDRASYLAHTRATGDRRAAWVAVIHVLLVAAGITVGLII
jgi:hypothetical protein